MKLKVFVRFVVVGLVCGVVSGCVPAAPAESPVVVRVASSGTQVRLSVVASATPSVEAYRFILRPPETSGRPEIVWDVTDGSRTKLFDAAAWLPDDGTPYSVSAAVVKAGKVSEETDPSSFKIAVNTVFHPAVPGTPGTPGATPTQVDAAEEQIKIEMIQAVNNERVLRGMSPLTRNATLETFVQGISERNAAAQLCTTPSAYGPAYPNTCHASFAETSAYYTPLFPFLGLGSNSLEGSSVAPLNTVVAWMNSQGHRNAILYNVPTAIGMGVACDALGGAWILMDTGGWDNLPHSPPPSPSSLERLPQATTNWSYGLQTPYPGTRCPSTVSSGGTAGTPAWNETILNVG